MKVLLIEEDPSLIETLTDILNEQHYIVDYTQDGETAWEFLQAFDYDLLILDVILPKLDGISLCRRLRAHGYRIPILILTAHNDSNQRIQALDAGADDYVVKPYQLEELLARIRALLRRGRAYKSPIIKWGELSVNTNSNEVTYQNNSVKLTAKEYCLLELFLRHGCCILTRRAIMNKLWSLEEYPNEHAVKTHILRLRKKTQRSWCSR